jgi:hypothetical protein
MMDAESIALVVASVAALRARVPRLDGWLVLPVAAIVTALVVLATGSGPWVEQLKRGVLTWIGAIGSTAMLTNVTKQLQQRPAGG